MANATPPQEILEVRLAHVIDDIIGACCSQDRARVEARIQLRICKYSEDTPSCDEWRLVDPWLRSWRGKEESSRFPLNRARGSRGEKVGMKARPRLAEI